MLANYRQAVLCCLVLQLVALIASASEESIDYSFTTEQQSNSTEAPTSIFSNLPIESYPIRLPMIVGVGFLAGSVVFATIWCMYWKVFAKEGPRERLDFD